MITPSLFSLIFAFSGPPAQLHYSPDFILKEVFALKKIELNQSKPLPQVKFESQTSLQEFQDAVEPQWGIRPEAITNVYVVRLNTVYLSDDPRLYAPMHRCLDDALAHEFTHYVQVIYQGANLGGDANEIDTDAYESDAIDVQNKFREQFCSSMR